MTDAPRLKSRLAGRWVDGSGAGARLLDPVSGACLATASTEGLDLGEALAFARATGGPALRRLTYGERAGLLDAVAAILVGRREAYGEIARRNSGNTKADAAIDIDGAIGTLKFYARAGAKLGAARLLLDGGPLRLAKDEAFQAQHVLVPLPGVAVHVNAFNFPAWGLWEKAAVSLLAGVPALVKPATATAWLAAEMVKDVIEAGVLPEGALSLLAGAAGPLLDHLDAGDALLFTGSAATAARLRRHEAVIERGVRLNVEADSLNAAVLGPGEAPGSPSFDAFVAEVAREMTQKAGQKCTAIRRAFVPADAAGPVAEALLAALARVTVGDPALPDVTMGPLVSREQRQGVEAGIEALRRVARALTATTPPEPKGVGDPRAAAFVAPTLLEAPLDAAVVHDLEVFGPVATLLSYRDEADAFAGVRRARGSLAASLFSGDARFLVRASAALATAHGRILAVDPSIAASHTGHGIVMPMCVHGGPGRAGGGEELGGLRALAFYHQRTAVQAAKATLSALGADGVDLASLG